jgi:glycosyltransferase involved in cell wall biosynthesis
VAEAGKRTRVLVVCMVDSIHSARWIDQFRDQPVDFVLFPSTPNRQVHPRLKALLGHEAADGLTVRIAPFAGMLSIPLWGMDLILDDHVRGWLLRREIRRFQPDYVHALELNNGGYVASRAYAGVEASMPPLIATNWGSDIFWFQRTPKHAKRIGDLMRRARYYSAECNRDIDLAITHGFTGDAFDVFPNAGGFAESQLTAEHDAPSTRQTVVVKGYEGWVGRASIALQVVELVAEYFVGRSIVVYSANLKTQRLAAALARRTGLDITVHPKRALSHQQMMELFARARTYIGISLSDGISTSLLEAMVAGAFPIQTNTSCADEWLIDGTTGIIVDAGDVEGIAAALRTALTDDALVDAAAAANHEVAVARLGDESIRRKSFRFYGLGSSSDIGAA